MGKYIDSEKLITLIERQKEHLSPSELDERGAIIAYGVVLGTIIVLQQEQSHFADADKMEQPEVELEKLGEIARHIIAVKQNVEDMRLSEDEWSLLERIGYPQKLNARKK